MKCFSTGGIFIYIFSSWLSEGDVGKVWLVLCDNSVFSFTLLVLTDTIIFPWGNVVHLLSTTRLFLDRKTLANVIEKPSKWSLRREEKFQVNSKETSYRVKLEGQRTRFKKDLSVIHRQTQRTNAEDLWCFCMISDPECLDKSRVQSLGCHWELGEGSWLDVCVLK